MALVIATVMALALAAPAMAATITINQDTTAATNLDLEGQSGTAGTESYYAYKIFDVTKTASVAEPVTSDSTVGQVPTATGFAYSIKSDSPWFSTVAGISKFVGDAGQTDSTTPYFVLTKTSETGGVKEYSVAWNLKDAEKNPAGYDVHSPPERHAVSDCTGMTLPE